MTRTSQKVSFSRRKSSTPKKRPLNKDGQQTKKRRTKSGTQALREIKHYQKTTQLLLRKMPFLRLVKQILEDMYPFRESYRWQAAAVQALQEVAETYLIHLFEHSNIVAANSKRCTIMLRDMQTVRRIRGYDDIANR